LFFCWQRLLKSIKSNTFLLNCLAGGINFVTFAV